MQPIEPYLLKFAFALSEKINGRNPNDANKYPSTAVGFFSPRWFATIFNANALLGTLPFPVGNKQPFRGLIPCPFFSAIVLSQTSYFPRVFGGFLERRMPGKNGEVTPRSLFCNHCYLRCCCVFSQGHSIAHGLFALNAPLADLSM